MSILPSLTEQGEEILLRGVPWILSLPTAGGLLRAKEEAASLQDLGEPALVRNACLLAQSLLQNGSPVFPSGKEVLEELTAGEISGLGQRLAQLQAVWDPSPEGSERLTQQRKEALREDSYGRLRWRVLRAFHALPTEARVQQMHPRDYLDCALHLILDQEEELEQLCPSCQARLNRDHCPGCGAPLSQWHQGQNAAFDPSRFEALSREVRK
jgi:hypothetical protein